MSDDRRAGGWRRALPSLGVLLGAALLRLGFRRRHHRGSARPRPAPGQTVPLEDAPQDTPIYTAAVLWLALLGAALGGAALGLVAFLVAAGVWPIAGLGQFASGGLAVASFAGASMGAAAGGLAGGLAGVLSLPARSIIQGAHAGAGHAGPHTRSSSRGRS